jgi:chromosome segregation protein
MVSLEGDLVEERGLLTGGHFVERMNVFKERKALGEWSKKLADSEEGRQKTSLELNSLAKKLGELRKKKAEQEIRVREAELESRYLAQEEQSVLEKRKNISAEVKLLEQEIRELNKLVEERDEERAALVRKLSELNVRMLDAKQEVDVEREQTLGMKVKEAERKMGDLRIRISQYQSAISSLNAQHAAYEREIMSYDSQEKEATHEISDAKNLLKELDLKIKEDLRVLEEKMREQKNVSRELQDLIEARDKIERELQKYGNEKGRLEFRREELVQKNQKEELSKVAVETKLADLKAEFEALSGASVLEGKAFGDKPALNARLIQVERELNEIGPVNLKALELYEEKEVELKQQMQKVDLLLNEKNAILAMIQEIDGKKEDTFMNSFNAVNENFQKLFGYIFLGRGTLFLENLNEAGEKKPFGDWGLTIQLQLENKEVKYLELMSGGEKALIALLFLFALQMSGASAVYIFDEADAALDEENSAKFASLLKRIAQQSQVLIVTHNETVFKQADCLIGIAMGREGSKLVEVKLGGLA